MLAAENPAETTSEGAIDALHRFFRTTAEKFWISSQFGLQCQHTIQVTANSS
jgi:hypothetical protein